MNQIVINFILTGQKFTLEMHLGEPEFTHSTGGPFTKNKKRILKIKEAGD